MTDRFVFRRTNSGKFDLSEAALREVVGDHRIVASESVHWPLGEAAETEFLQMVADLHFAHPEREYIACHRHVRAKRPILFALTWIRRAPRDDSSATFQAPADGAS